MIITLPSARGRVSARSLQGRHKPSPMLSGSGADVEIFFSVQERTELSALETWYQTLLHRAALKDTVATDSNPS